MKIRKWGIILFLLLSVIYTSTAQNKADYIYSPDKDKVTLLVKINRAQLAKVDSIDELIGAPFRIAEIYPLEVDVNAIGKWEMNSGLEKRWKFTIAAPLANGMLIYFKKFYIPAGAKLYVYDERGIENAGIYTNNENIDGGIYVAETYMGEEVTMEYVAPSTLGEAPDIQIRNIGYKDRDINPYYNSFKQTKADYENQADVCMTNINCPEGEPWQKEKRGVVRLATVIGGKGYACTGSLVNNTREDMTPYILSAYHCFNTGGKTANFNDVTVYFDDESAGCEVDKVRPVPTKQMSGVISLVQNPLNGGSDGALVKLKGTINSNWHVYFNGWDRRTDDNIFRNGVVIHHPRGDVKKISFYANNLTSSQWVNSEGTGLENGHWQTQYTQGVTQGGSSGSPIFSQDGLIIGTLTGGGSKCNGMNPSGIDYFGKFGYHWDKLQVAGQRIDEYLDPLGTGVEQLRGISNWSENEDLKLSSSSVKMAKLTTREETIITGNRGYKIVSSAPNIADATIDGSYITIEAGNKAGTAVLTVSDWQNKTATLNVEVYQEQSEDFSITHSITPDRRLKLWVYLEEDQIEQIRIFDLSGRMLYSKNNIGSAVYEIDPISNSGNIYIIRIDTKNGASKKVKIRW